MCTESRGCSHLLYCFGDNVSPSTSCRQPPSFVVETSNITANPKRCRQALNPVRLIVCYIVQCLHKELLRTHCARGSPSHFLIWSSSFPCSRFQARQNNDIRIWTWTLRLAYLSIFTTNMKLVKPFDKLIVNSTHISVCSCCEYQIIVSRTSALQREQWVWSWRTLFCEISG